MPKIAPDTICGIPVARIRPLFKPPNIIAYDSTRAYQKEHLQEKFGLSDAEATNLIKELQELGYLSIEHDDEKYYTVTSQGKQFGLEKSNKPISIEKADTLYAEFLDRIRVVNENPEFLLKVCGYGMWGNYISGNQLVNTIEIVLLFEHKDAESYEEKRKEAWDNHPSYLGIDQRYSLPQTQIQKYIKARSPYLSIYLPTDQKSKASTVKFFDADGNYTHYTYKKKKDVDEPSNSKPSRENAAASSVGRLLLNERPEKSSKKQIVRKFTQKEVELLNVHDQVLDGMVKILRKEHPECITSPECFIVGLGNRIDIVRQTKDGIIILYEIKTYAKAISSIRMALGQLFEYSFYPDRKLSQEFYIVSHVAASLADLKYLKHVEQMLGIKIGYIHYDCETNQIAVKQ